MTPLTVINVLAILITVVIVVASFVLFPQLRRIFTRKKKMNKVRLLKVRAALLSVPRDTKLNSSCTIKDGIPMCPLGYYASNKSVQNTFEVIDSHVYYGDNIVNWDDEGVQNHFEISPYVSELLFGEEACASADTTGEAADFIEAFCKIWPR